MGGERPATGLAAGLRGRSGRPSVGAGSRTFTAVRGGLPRLRTDGHRDCRGRASPLLTSTTMTTPFLPPPPRTTTTVKASTTTTTTATATASVPTIAETAEGAGDT